MCDKKKARMIFFTEHAHACEAMEGSATMGECFVCCQQCDSPTRAVCGCNDRYVHPHCLLRMIRECPAHERGCPVCQQPYAVDYTERRSFTFPSCRLDLMALDVAGSICCGYICFAAYVIFARAFEDSVEGTSVNMGILVPMAIMLCIVYAWVRIRFVDPISEGRWNDVCCCYIKCTRDVPQLTFRETTVDTTVDASPSAVSHQIV